ncbi:MAG: SDR family NAD(P)-dependent oxidoreductase [Ignavibacteriaceae bacterium]|nr:SDR family NAD(P)-dependent oxidoreductase [Ignavibacteriaceae bacterium]
MYSSELVIVTGASRGIGRAIANKFASEHKDVMLFGRDEEALETVYHEVRRFKVESEFFAGDVADEEFVNRSVKQILDKYGKVDHLINNAGMGIFKRFVDSELKDFKQQIDTNLYGIYNFTKAVVNSMISKRSGSIINISSLAGKNSFVTGTMYSAAKHAVMGFTKSLMLELREYNIRVAVVCPGSVDTEFFNTTDIKPKLEKILKPSDIAEIVSSIVKLPPNALMSEVDVRPTNPN